MKNKQIPIQNPNFVLQVEEDEHQLLNLNEQTSIFINDSAAIIWQLCNGEQKVSQIKSLLKTSYPSMAGGLDADVDETIKMLESHQALTAK
jgi:hypothetical protein